MATDALLEARAICRRHPDGRGRLLDDVSLEVRPGDRIALTGPSGSGKTLLLRALVLLDPLDSGEVRWQGEAVRRDMIPAFRRQAIYLHQRPAFGQDTVASALESPLAFRAHRGRRFDRDRVLGYLRQLGRDALFLDKRVRDLSGGEMQVAALVRAIQLEPAMLLLDEPTAALDAETAAAVEALIAGWVDDAPDRRAFLWVGHDREQARRVTRRSLAVEEGRVTDGPW